MFRSNILKFCLLLFLSVFPLFYLGCGGGSGGGNDSDGTATQAAVVDEASVTEEMRFVEASIPGCKIVETAEMAAGVMGWRSAGESSGALAGLFATLNAARNQSSDYLTSIAIGPIEIKGDCGGTLTLSSAYSRGSTTYTLIFKDFCSPEDIASPPEEIKINGKLIVTEIGTPSTAGVIILKYMAETDGKLTVTAGGEKVSLTLDNFIYTMGLPGVEPGMPTIKNPDRIALDQAAVNFETQKRMMILTDLRATSYESGNDKIAELASARFAISDKGYVDMFTSQPLVMNSDGDMVSGALDFTGAKGNTATVAIGDESGKFIVKINGEPMDQCMDCSDMDLDGIISLPL